MGTGPVSRDDGGMAEKDAAKAAGARWDWAMRAWFAPPRNLMDAAESREPSSLDHVPIYEAIEIKDATAAVAAMATHMEGATCRLRAAMAASTGRVFHIRQSHCTAEA